MTTPTAPDGDRLPATNSGQDNPWDRRCDLGHLIVQGMCAERRTVDGDVRYTFVAHHPAPQQPPAQELNRRAAVLHPEGATLEQRAEIARAMHPAPPSEADSAGEDPARLPLARWLAEGYSGEEYAEQSAGNDHWMGLATEVLELIDRKRAAALAASPGVQGGPWRVGSHYGIHVYEGDRPVATFLDPADAERAVRDHNAGVQGGDGEARERLAAVLADDNQLNLGIVIGVHHSKRVEFWARVAEIAVRAAGGSR